MYDRLGAFLFSEFQFAEDELKLELGIGFRTFKIEVQQIIRYFIGSNP